MCVCVYLKASCGVGGRGANRSCGGGVSPRIRPPRGTMHRRADCIYSYIYIYTQYTSRAYIVARQNASAKFARAEGGSCINKTGIAHIRVDRLCRHLFHSTNTTCADRRDVYILIYYTAGQDWGDFYTKCERPTFSIVKAKKKNKKEMLVSGTMCSSLFIYNYCYCYYYLLLCWCVCVCVYFVRDDETHTCAIHVGRSRRMKKNSNNILMKLGRYYIFTILGILRVVIQILLLFILALYVITYYRLNLYIQSLPFISPSIEPLYDIKEYNTYLYSQKIL